MTFAIDVWELNKSFSNKHIIKDLNLSINTGQIYGFLGPNGSGKTTTLRMLCGLLTPDSGRGHCLGYDILTQSLMIKRHVGYMTQSFGLYTDLSIRENLDFIARLYQVDNRQQAVQDGLNRLGLSKINSNQLAGTLSGGWKQRVALAAALIHKPKLLLLDEPTAGVDPSARRQFWDEIHTLSAEGITTLVSTHYMDEAERCHELAYIANGSILVKGNIDEIIHQAKLFTWEVKGEKLFELAAILRKQEGVEQVTAFGRSLHVSGKNEQTLELAITPFRTRYHWSLISSNLEDIFIHLVGDMPENIHG